MIERVLSAIHQVIKDNHEDVAIVTHSAVIMCLQCYITNTNFEEMTTFKSHNTSITEIESGLLIQQQQSG